MKNGSAVTTQVNTREGERLTCDLSVIVDGPEMVPFRGRLRDVSLTGAGIDCADADRIDLMEPVELVIRLPRGKRRASVRIPGFVARSSEGWLGVMFMIEAPWLLESLRDLALWRESNNGRRRQAVSQAPVPSPILAGADS